MAATSGLYGSSVDTANRTRSAVAELIGTALLVYAITAVASASITERAIAGPPLDSLAVGLVSALVLVALVAALGHVSGAHLNPAVTIALAATRKFPWPYVPAYVGAQLVGAILGALMTWLTLGDGARDVANLAATYPADDVAVLRALIVEAFVTFLLMFVIMAVAVDDRVPSTSTASIAVGFALGVGVLVAGPVSGGALNPVRALGPMIAAGDLTAFWLYIVGPIGGALLAALAYDRFVSDADAPDAPEDEAGATDREGRVSVDRHQGVRSTV